MLRSESVPAYIPPPIAEISTWSNNCALSCTSIFLVNAFLSKKLSRDAERHFREFFNTYYQISLSVEQLRDVFQSILTLPADRQVIIGSVLRKFIVEVGVPIEQDNMLSNEAFEPLARVFDFNVQFYADLEGKIIESGAIPPITIDQSFSLTLRPYYHHNHYDLIMDSIEAAQEHNQASFIESEHHLPIERGEEEALKIRVRNIIQELYAVDLQQQELGRQIDRLWGLARDLEASDNVDDAAKVALLASELKERYDAFSRKLMPERMASLELFKHDFMKLIRDADGVLGKPGVLDNFLSGLYQVLTSISLGQLGGSLFFSSSKKVQLQSSLNDIERKVNSLE